MNRDAGWGMNKLLLVHQSFLAPQVNTCVTFTLILRDMRRGNVQSPADDDQANGSQRNQNERVDVASIAASKNIWRIVPRATISWPRWYLLVVPDRGESAYELRQKRVYPHQRQSDRFHRLDNDSCVLICDNVFSLRIVQRLVRRAGPDEDVR